MARWKELPATVDEPERQLVVQLRRLKDHSGLSLAALAARTSYSRSSWERYLNGKQAVPREAVEELTLLCGTEPTRLLVLHEVAVRERKSAQSEELAPAADVQQPPAVRMVPVRRMLVGTAAAVVVAFAAGLLTGGAWDNHSPKSPKDPAQVSDAGYRRGQIYPCKVGRRNGLLGAGRSTSREILLDINSVGWDVVEAQCLLAHHGFDPGGADGLYGEGTKQAALRFQKARGLAVDGIVGPVTWGELRR